MKRIVLDLYCKAGGAARGYQRAGFFVVGVDHKPQPRYAGDAFVQMDALEALRILLAGGTVAGYRLEELAVIHASPPCQNSSRTKTRWPDRQHPELIPPTRELLRRTGLPYVIENVVGARLIEPVILCGSMFGLAVRRHRPFETSFPLAAPCCRHHEQPFTVGVYGHTGQSADRGRPRREGRLNDAAEWRWAMGIDWMTVAELAEAIPPAYAEHVGRTLQAYLGPA